MQSIIDKVREVIIPHQEELNINLFDIKCVRLKKSWLIRIFIDSENGVTVDKCEEISHFIGSRLDNFMEGKYRLEVSSPGIERPLRNKEDYQRYKGHLAEIKISSQDLKKSYLGYIKDLKDDILTLQVKDTSELIQIPCQEIIKAKLRLELK
ncbi:ribosome maturation factor RimP [bacterium]|nr:ribosome maturation factor RimP [bacterium]